MFYDGMNNMRRTTFYNLHMRNLIVTYYLELSTQKGVQGNFDQLRNYLFKPIYLKVLVKRYVLTRDIIAQKTLTSNKKGNPVCRSPDVDRHPEGT